jgi:hypothetical protein
MVLALFALIPSLAAPSAVPAPSEVAEREGARPPENPSVALEQRVARVATLSDDELRAASAAVTDLSTNCAYHRATVLLVLTLDRELPLLDPSALDPQERAAFEQLVRGVAAQAALARALGADTLPAPMFGDYLSGDLLTGWRPFQDGAAFEASTDPVADTEALFAVVPHWVAAMPSGTMSRLDQDWEVLAPVVDRYTWFHAVETGASSYQALLPGLARGATGERALRLGRLLETHGTLYC